MLAKSNLIQFQRHFYSELCCTTYISCHFFNRLFLRIRISNGILLDFPLSETCIILFSLRHAKKNNVQIKKNTFIRSLNLFNIIQELKDRKYNILNTIFMDKILPYFLVILGFFILPTALFIIRKIIYPRLKRIYNFIWFLIMSILISLLYHVTGKTSVFFSEEKLKDDDKFKIIQMWIQSKNEHKKEKDKQNINRDKQRTAI